MSSDVDRILASRCGPRGSRSPGCEPALAPARAAGHDLDDLDVVILLAQHRADALERAAHLDVEVRLVARAAGTSCADRARRDGVDRDRPRHRAGPASRRRANRARVRLREIGARLGLAALGRRRDLASSRRSRGVVLVVVLVGLRLGILGLRRFGAARAAPPSARRARAPRARGAGASDRAARRSVAASCDLLGIDLDELLVVVRSIGCGEQLVDHLLDHRHARREHLRAVVREVERARSGARRRSCRRTSRARRGRSQQEHLSGIEPVE